MGTRTGAAHGYVPPDSAPNTAPKVSPWDSPEQRGDKALCALRALGRPCAVPLPVPAGMPGAHGTAGEAAGNE